MKSTWLTPVVTQQFQKVRFMTVVVLVAGLLPWIAADFIASLAATQMTTHTTLRTTSEKDDARLIRAFQSVRRDHGVEATLATEPDPRQETRDAVLTIIAGTKREALDELASTLTAIKTAFAQDGVGELYDIGNTPRARMVPNSQTILLGRLCRWGGLLILVGGLTFVANSLLRSGLPLTGILAVGGGLAGAGLLFFGGAFIWLSALPILLVVLVMMLTLRVKRAANWEESQAHITKSEVAMQRHRFSGEGTRITNLASVAYDFAVGSEHFHGTRISLGFGPSDRVDETLKRYPVGSTVPVYYDPVNPAECVLERKAPTSLGCLWGGVLVAILLYGTVLLSIGRSEAIAEKIRAALPSAHHPIVTLVGGLFGCLCIGSFLWNRRHIRQAFPWLTTKGRIVSSKIESYMTFTSGQSGSQRRCYRALIEFAYTVDGQEYHNTVNESATTRESAEKEAARFPVGTELEIHYDPQNPTSSALEIDKQMVLDGRASLVVGLVALAVAIYAAFH